MYRILLVDDEMMELDALKNYIDWKGLGIGQVYSAKNGKAAYELVLEKQPDIVITDIQMPVMDGITLAKKIYELNRHIKIVFLTGYDEFTYVKEAMRVDAVDFLLKPFSEESIAEVIRRVKEEIEKDTLFINSVGVMEQGILRRICVEEETDDRVLLEELKRTRRGNIPVSEYGMIQFWGVSCTNLAVSMEKRLAEVETLWADGRSLTFLIRGYADVQNAAIRIRRIMEELTGKTYSCVYLRHNSRPEGLRDSYRILKSWENALFYEKSGCIKAVEEVCPAPKGGRSLDPEQLEKVTRQLEEGIRSGKEEEISGVLGGLFSYCLEEKSNRDKLLIDIYRLLFRMDEKFLYNMNGMDENKRQEKKNESWELIGNMVSVFEIQDFVIRYFQHLSAAYGEGSGSKNSFVVKKVMEYVQEHYDQAVTVEGMAEQIHLSSNYIRSIFKEGTGQTILEYITNYRFERACELLKQPTLKVKEVSNRVGYENVSYFCAVFTRRFGMSPNEYRKKFI